MRRPLLAALVVFAVALPAFLVLRSDSEPDPSIPRSEAVAIARASPQVQKQLERVGDTSTRVTVLDADHQRVGFFRDSRLVLVALVGPDRTVTQAVPGSGVVGNRIANQPALLIGLSLVFVLALAGVPLLSLRNIDVLALASFTVVAWLTGQGFLDASLYVAYPLLAYLALRFLLMATRGSRAEDSMSLYWRLTGSWSPDERRHVLRLLAAGLAALTAILTVTSSGVSDVAFASLAGATDLVHGVVPYGHIPDFIIHGDTYPPLNYVAYVPVAALWPVSDAFGDPQGALVLTAVLTLLAAMSVYRLVGRNGPKDPSEEAFADSEPSELAGLRAAVAWLTFPPVLLAASSGSNDIVLAFCLLLVLGSVASARRSAMLLGVATWVKVTPIVALPIWIARLDRREAVQAIAGLALFSAVILGGLIAMGGPGAVTSMVDAMRFQFERRSLFSLFGMGVGLGPLQAVAQALLLASVVGITLAVRRDADLRDDPVRLAATLAALMLLSQLAANYWSWAYMPWVIGPALLVLAPGRARWEPQHAGERVHSNSNRRGSQVVRKPGVPAPVDASTSALP
jgi:hypothetical protein